MDGLRTGRSRRRNVGTSRFRALVRSPHWLTPVPDCFCMALFTKLCLTCNFHQMTSVVSGGLWILPSSLAVMSAARACQRFVMADPLNPHGLAPWLFPWGHIFCQPPRIKHPYIPQPQDLGGYVRWSELNEFLRTAVLAPTYSALSSEGIFLQRGNINPFSGQITGKCGSRPCVRLSACGWDFTVLGHYDRSHVGSPDRQLEPLSTLPARAPAGKVRRGRELWQELFSVGLAVDSPGIRPGLQHGDTATAFQAPQIQVWEGQAAHPEASELFPGFLAAGRRVTTRATLGRLRAGPTINSSLFLLFPLVSFPHHPLQRGKLSWLLKMPEVL